MATGTCTVQCSFLCIWLHIDGSTRAQLTSQSVGPTWPQLLRSYLEFSRKMYFLMLLILISLLLLTLWFYNITKILIAIKDPKESSKIIKSWKVEIGLVIDSCVVMQLWSHLCIKTYSGHRVCCAPLSLWTKEIKMFQRLHEFSYSLNFPFF